MALRLAQVAADAVLTLLPASGDADARQSILTCVPPNMSITAALGGVFVCALGVVTLVIAWLWHGGACCCKNLNYRPATHDHADVAAAESRYPTVGDTLLAMLHALLASCCCRCFAPARHTQIIASMRTSVSLFGVLTAPAFVTARKRWVVWACATLLSLGVTLATAAALASVFQTEQCQHFRACWQASRDHASLLCVDAKGGADADGVGPCGAWAEQPQLPTFIPLDTRFFIWPNTTDMRSGSSPHPACMAESCVASTQQLKGATRSGWLCRACPDLFVQTKKPGNEQPYCYPCVEQPRLVTTSASLLVGMIVQRPAMAGLNRLSAHSWNDCNFFLKWIFNLYTCALLVLVGSAWYVWELFDQGKLPFPWIWLASPLVLDSVIAFTFICLEACMGACCARCCGRCGVCARCLRAKPSPLDAYDDDEDEHAYMHSFRTTALLQPSHSLNDSSRFSGSGRGSPRSFMARPSGRATERQPRRW